MAQPLTAEEAYLAGLHDVKVATSMAQDYIDRGLMPKSNFAKIIREELEYLWRGRIDRGELPPILSEQQIFEKAS